MSLTVAYPTTVHPYPVPTYQPTRYELSHRRASLKAFSPTVVAAALARRRGGNDRGCDRCYDHHSDTVDAVRFQHSASLHSFLQHLPHPMSGIKPTPPRRLPSAASTPSSLSYTSTSRKKSQPPPAVGASHSRLVSELREYDTNDIVSAAITVLLQREMTQSPLVLLEKEYGRQVSQPGLDGPMPVLERPSTSGGGISHRGGAHHSLSMLPSAPPKTEAVLHAHLLQASHAALDRTEVIQRQQQEMAALRDEVRYLKSVLVQESTGGGGGVAVGGGVGGVIDGSSSSRDLRTVDDATTSKQVLVALNSKLQDYVETLEHNMSMGLVYCEESVMQDYLELRRENERLATMSARLASSTVDLMNTNDALTARVDELHNSLMSSERRRDQAEKDLTMSRQTLFALRHAGGGSAVGAALLSQPPSP